jgi:cytoskeleton protein RodZ
MTVGPSMSDVNEAQAAIDAPASTLAGPSAGTLLRTAREAAGIHIGALAVSLKIPVKKLEALEADDLAQLPDAVFARALAASVCRSLKIDSEPVLQMLPQLHAPSIPVGNTGQAVRLESHRGFRLAGSFGLPKPVLLVTAALLIGAVAVMLLPTLRGAADVAVSGISVLPHIPMPAPTIVQVPVVSVPETAASDSSPAVVPEVAASAGIAQISAALSPTATAEPNAVAVFTAREKAWVQVLGADGVVHLRKTVDAGETVRINGALPLSVVIGRADAIGVLVRGKSFDLTAVAQDNVMP